MKIEFIQYSFAFFLIVKLCVKLWLNKHNVNYIMQHKNQVPVEFQSKINLEDHQKAADYSVTRAVFGRFNFLIDICIMVFWLFSGALNQIDLFLRSFNYNETVTGLLFFLLFGLISFVIDLPARLYSTFVIEEKFGFNKTTPKIFIQDTLKQFIVGIVIGGILLSALLTIIQFLGEFWWIWGWGFFMGFQFLLIWAYPKFIAPLFNKFSELDDKNLTDRIRALLKKIQLEFKDFYVMNASMRSSHGNAYFTGFGKNRRIVFFDTLLSTLDEEEVEAVLAHELGHLKHKHIFKSIVISTIFFLIGFAILGYLYNSLEFYSSFKVINKSSYMALILFSFITPVYTFLITPIQSWFSRKNEYEADEFATKYSNGESLIQALLKMYKDNSSTLTPSPLYSKFYFSHPPASERVAFIKSKL